MKRTFARQRNSNSFRIHFLFFLHPQTSRIFMAAYQKTSKGVGVDGVLRKLIFVIQYIYKYVYNIYTKYQAAAARPGPEAQ